VQFIKRLVRGGELPGQFGRALLVWICLLPALETAQGVERGKELLASGQVQRELVSRMDHIGAVVIAMDPVPVPARRADRREIERRYKVAVREPFAELVDHRGNTLVLRRPLDQPHNRLDIGAEADELGCDLCLVRRGRAERYERRPIGHAEGRSGARRAEKSPSCLSHG
jgi:hypothetical protein